MHPVHLALWSAALVAAVVGARYAGDHRLSRHHVSIGAAVLLLTVSVALVLLQRGGDLGARWRALVAVYLYVVFTAASGTLFFGGIVSRAVHRSMAAAAVALMGLIIVLTFL